MGGGEVGEKPSRGDIYIYRGISVILLINVAVLVFCGDEFVAPRDHLNWW